MSIPYHIKNNISTVKKVPTKPRFLPLFYQFCGDFDNKAEDLTIKKLTARNPTMAQKFAARLSRERLDIRMRA
jgi:hypothetical protein